LASLIAVFSPWLGFERLAAPFASNDAWLLDWFCGSGGLVFAILCVAGIPQSLLLISIFFSALATAQNLWTVGFDLCSAVATDANYWHGVGRLCKASSA
jgi:hypothetical protein